MTNLVLHVGFGKTGSSSIQHHLTWHGSDRIGDTRYVYCVVDPNGNVTDGEALRSMARKTGVDYAASAHNFPSSHKQVEALKASLARYHKRGLTPILSQEAWGQDAHLFKEPLRQLGLDVRVIAYVRPQVEFLNAGWWQWWFHMREFESPQALIDAWTIDFLGWIDYVARWKNIPEVAQLDVRCHGRDSVNDLLSLLGSAPVDAARVNTSLGPLAIKLYRRFPGLRGVHNAQVDAKYGPMLANGKKAPWVVPMPLCSRIIEHTRPGNLRLAQTMSDAQRELMLNNPRWWNPEAYAREKLATPADLNMSFGDAITIAHRVLASKLADVTRSRSTSRD